MLQMLPTLFHIQASVIRGLYYPKSFNQLIESDILMQAEIANELNAKEISQLTKRTNYRSTDWLTGSSTSS